MAFNFSYKMKIDTRKFMRELDREVERGMDDAAKFVTKKAKQLVPVDTGRLRASIDYELNKVRSGYKARIYGNTEYAIFVELGTYKMDAQPYLRPALFNYRRDVLRKVAGK
jgi:HK97 gp10 family phage protein